MRPSMQAHPLTSIVEGVNSSSMSSDEVGIFRQEQLRDGIHNYVEQERTKD